MHDDSSGMRHRPTTGVAVVPHNQNLTNNSNNTAKSTATTIPLKFRHQPDFIERNCPAWFNRFILFFVHNQTWFTFLILAWICLVFFVTFVYIGSELGALFLDGELSRVLAGLPRKRQEGEYEQIDTRPWPARPFKINGAVPFADYGKNFSRSTELSNALFSPSFIISFIVAAFRGDNDYWNFVNAFLHSGSAVDDMCRRFSAECDWLTNRGKELRKVVTDVALLDPLNTLLRGKPGPPSLTQWRIDSDFCLWRKCCVHWNYLQGCVCDPLNDGGLCGGTGDGTARCGGGVCRRIFRAFPPTLRLLTSTAKPLSLILARDAASHPCRGVPFRHDAEMFSSSKTTPTATTKEFNRQVRVRTPDGGGFETSLLPLSMLFGNNISNIHNEYRCRAHRHPRTTWEMPATDNPRLPPSASLFRNRVRFACVIEHWFGITNVHLTLAGCLALAWQVGVTEVVVPTYIDHRGENTELLEDLFDFPALQKSARQHGIDLFMHDEELVFREHFEEQVAAIDFCVAQLYYRGHEQFPLDGCCIADAKVVTNCKGLKMKTAAGWAERLKSAPLGKSQQQQMPVDIIKHQQKLQQQQQQSDSEQLHDLDEDDAHEDDAEMSVFCASELRNELTAFFRHPEVLNERWLHAIVHRNELDQRNTSESNAISSELWELEGRSFGAIGDRFHHRAQQKTKGSSSGSSGNYPFGTLPKRRGLAAATPRAESVWDHCRTPRRAVTRPPPPPTTPAPPTTTTATTTTTTTTTVSLNPQQLHEAKISREAAEALEAERRMRASNNNGQHFGFGRVGQVGARLVEENNGKKADVVENNNNNNRRPFDFSVHQHSFPPQRNFNDPKQFVPGSWQRRIDLTSRPDVPALTMRVSGVWFSSYNEFRSGSWLPTLDWLRPSEAMLRTARDARQKILAAAAAQTPHGATYLAVHFRYEEDATSSWGFSKDDFLLPRLERLASDLGLGAVFVSNSPWNDGKPDFNVSRPWFSGASFFDKSSSTRRFRTQMLDRIVVEEATVAVVWNPFRGYSSFSQKIYDFRCRRNGGGSGSRREPMTTFSYSQGTGDSSLVLEC